MGYWGARAAFKGVYSPLQVACQLRQSGGWWRTGPARDDGGQYLQHCLTAGQGRVAGGLLSKLVQVCLPCSLHHTSQRVPVGEGQGSPHLRW